MPAAAPPSGLRREASRPRLHRAAARAVAFPMPAFSSPLASGVREPDPGIAEGSNVASIVIIVAAARRRRGAGSCERMFLLPLRSTQTSAPTSMRARRHVGACGLLLVRVSVAALGMLVSYSLVIAAPPTGPLAVGATVAQMLVYSRRSPTVFFPKGADAEYADVIVEKSLVAARRPTAEQQGLIDVSAGVSASPSMVPWRETSATRRSVTRQSRVVGVSRFLLPPRFTEDTRTPAVDDGGTGDGGRIGEDGGARGDGTGRGARGRGWG
jgi:hypothetical protein